MLNVIESGTLKDVEKLVIKARLDALKWNRTHTAKSLKIGLRTLQRKMKSYDLLSLEPVSETPSQESANEAVPS